MRGLPRATGGGVATPAPTVGALAAMTAGLGTGAAGGAGAAGGTTSGGGTTTRRDTVVPVAEAGSSGCVCRRWPALPLPLPASGLSPVAGPGGVPCVVGSTGRDPGCAPPGSLLAAAGASASGDEAGGHAARPSGSLWLWVIAIAMAAAMASPIVAPANDPPGPGALTSSGGGTVGVVAAGIVRPLALRALAALVADPAAVVGAAWSGVPDALRRGLGDGLGDGFGDGRPAAAAPSPSTSGVMLFLRRGLGDGVATAGAGATGATGAGSTVGAGSAAAVAAGAGRSGVSSVLAVLLPLGVRRALGDGGGVARRSVCRLRRRAAPTSLTGGDATSLSAVASIFQQPPARAARDRWSQRAAPGWAHTPPPRAANSCA